jgi:hypothetical protein
LYVCVLINCCLFNNISNIYMYLRLTISTIQSNLYIKDIVADLSVEMVNGQFLDYLKSINQWLPIHSYSSRASSQIVLAQFFVFCSALWTIVCDCCSFSLWYYIVSFSVIKGSSLPLCILQTFLASIIIFHKECFFLY